MANLKIAAFRKAHGLTQQEMADRLGISRGHLSRIENGHEVLQEYLQLRIVRILDIADDDVNILLGAPPFRRRASVTNRPGYFRTVRSSVREPSCQEGARRT